MNTSTKTMSVALFGHVEVPVAADLLIELPGDATDEEIYGLAEELECLVQHWEDAYGKPEDPEYVTGTGELQLEGEVDEKADFTFIRNAEGKLVLHRAVS